MRLAAVIALLAGVATAQHDAGLVWHGLRAGWTASNAVHNSIDGHVGNTRGPITETPGGAVSNNSATASWVGWGTNYNPLAHATEFTIAGWIRMSGGAAVGWNLAGNVPSTGGSNMVQFTAYTSTRLACYIYTTAAIYRGMDISLPSMLTSNWVHVAVTWAGGTNLCLYRNGVQYRNGYVAVGSPSNSLGANLSHEWRIGAYANGANTMINSNALWNWRVYNRALAYNEITHLRATDRRLLP